MAKHPFTAIIALLAAVVVLGMPWSAMAAAVNTLYSGDVTGCGADGLNNLFSGFVCRYHQIVDQIMTASYYAMLDFFRQPFYAALILFTCVIGSIFALGLLPFTTRDIMLMLAKIALLTGFALYPSLMIDLVYQGLIGFMRETTDTVVGVLAPAGIGDVNGIFQWMDDQLELFLNNHEAARAADGPASCDNNILAMLFGLAVLMPPVFAMAMYLLIQFIMVFVRTVLSYLVAMTGIMFLTTLAPLFLGFGLFNFTRSYFEKWLSYLLAFAVQIFIVFAFIAVVLSLPFGDKIDAVNDIIQPVDRTAYHDGQRLNYDNWCSICATVGNPAEVLEPDTCDGAEITPTNVQGGGIGDFIQWVGEELIILAVMAYLVESVLKAAPEVSKYLTNTPYASAFNGRLPGEAMFSNAVLSGSRGLAQSPGIVSGSGNFIKNFTNTVIGGRG